MRRIITSLIAVALAATAAPARAQNTVAVLSAVALRYTPGAADGSTGSFQVLQGATLLFANLDPLGNHTVISDSFDENGHELFTTDDQVGFGLTGEVRGVEKLPVGSYGFYCTTHYPVMFGTMEIVPNP